MQRDINLSLEKRPTHIAMYKNMQKLNCIKLNFFNILNKKFYRERVLHVRLKQCVR